MKAGWKRALGRRVEVPIMVIIGWALLTLLIIVLLWSLYHRPATRFVVSRSASMKELLPSIAGLTGSSLREGNRIEILQNGELWEPLLADIDAAKHSVHFETFVWWDGEICQRLAKSFASAAARGVEVRVLLDASGSGDIGEELLKLMREAGAQVEMYQKFRVTNLGRLNNRDHRKIVVIDGRIGYTGGHGVAEEWTGDAQDKDHYRDTFARVAGPVVHDLQYAFSDNWIATTGEVFAGPAYFSDPAPAGTATAHVVLGTPSHGVSKVRLLYHLAIEAAEEELIIQNPYFLPDAEAMKAIERAAKRGVRVRIMLPSVRATDNAIVQHASHHHFGNFLEHGIEIYEYEPTLLHQKIMIVDRYWSHVGSTNFDDRSLEINDEVSLGIADEAIARELLQAFERDLEKSKQRKLDEWKDRGAGHKLKDGLAYLLHEQL